MAPEGLVGEARRAAPRETIADRDLGGVTLRDTRHAIRAGEVVP